MSSRLILALLAGSSVTHSRANVLFPDAGNPLVIISLDRTRIAPYLLVLQQFSNSIEEQGKIVGTVKWVGIA
jgi:hypothetical protein